MVFGIIKMIMEPLILKILVMEDTKKTTLNQKVTHLTLILG